MMNSLEQRTALSRIIQYCEEEAAELDLPFVAYFLSMATGALAEEANSSVIDFPTVTRLHGRKAD